MNKNKCELMGTDYCENECPLDKESKETKKTKDSFIFPKLELDDIIEIFSINVEETQDHVKKNHQNIITVETQETILNILLEYKQLKGL